jgi:predicted dehydrogenase
MAYRIGIVGAGFLTQHRLIKAIADIPDATLAAVLDPSDAARAAVAGLSPDTLVTADEAEFFDASLDAVHVATPNYLHEHFACRAIELGIATIVDKPLADTVESGRRILAASMSGPGVAMVGYMSKHNVYNREARRLIAAGAIGRPLAMVAARCGWRLKGWRRRPQTSGLGCLGDLGIYPVLTAVDVFGAEPVRYRASIWPVGDPEQSDLYAHATVWFDDERYLSFETAATFDQQPVSAEVSVYTVVGDEGVIQVNRSWAMDGSGSLDWCDASGWHCADLTPVDTYRVQYELLRRYAAGEPVPQEISIDRGLRDLAILYAIADSAAVRVGV